MIARLILLTASTILVMGGCNRSSGGAGTGGSGGSVTGGSGGTVTGGSGGTATGGSGGTATGGAGGTATGGSGGSGGAYHLHVPAQHRAVAATCSVDRDGGSSAGGSAPVTCGAGGAPGQMCTGQNPICCVVPEPGFGNQYYCESDACSTDSDCGATGVCLCDQGCTRNACRSGNCRVDADCGSGLYCSPWSTGCFTGFDCHTSEDECADSSDCPSDGTSCSYDPNVGHWRCQGNCVQ